MFTGAGAAFVHPEGYGLADLPQKASRDEVSKFDFVFDGPKAEFCVALCTVALLVLLVVLSYLPLLFWRRPRRRIR